MAKAKDKKTPKENRDEWRADVDARSVKAGYMVKDHGHRFFRMQLNVDPDTGEMYMPDGYKFTAFLWVDAADQSKVWVILKDEHLG
jgi:hypothetical protein